MGASWRVGTVGCFIVYLARCSSPQARSFGLANNGNFEPTISAKMRGLEPIFAKNELRSIAISSQRSMWTHIRCTQGPEGPIGRRL